MLKDSCPKNRPLKAILRLKRRSQFKTNGALFCGDILLEQQRKHLTLFQWAQLKSNAQIVNVYAAKEMEPRVGVEPTTCRLRIGCSTTELPRPNCYKRRRSALRAWGLAHLWPKSSRKRPNNAEGCQAIPLLYCTHRLLFRHAFNNPPASTFCIAFVVALDFITM